MTKEIIVNAAEMESRVAILENGRLMELHIEREQKIVGNIYKGRVTKVLKGMDAAFVDIGIELNAFLSASDVVAQDDDEDGGAQGNGRANRGPIPPITQLLHGNQEILVQVVRAPMGTKGARITTRLSLPGRYMVLMLNSGSYVGVSRKIEDSKERARLRSIANKIRPESYSLIVRTEAEGKSEEELHQDMDFLLDMAHRVENKAAHVSAPALVHGDMTLVLRLIRDAFTRDINRLVVDSPSAYENSLELVGMLSPHLKNRIYLYDEALPIFHAYNIEPEIERTLRRKVWLPSGGYLIVDQAEALTAIDVNTGRFVGSVELAETVLTTNLQAAEEVARQLRLRDLGGIIVVDFIDMDNPRHRSQVMKVFEDALHRDRAKIKVHNISPLGLVEMTRKRTGESLAGLLTEPCPYCSGIGRVQNALTMALRVQRELATTAVEHPETEAFLLIAHPRVIANMLGYEGEIHHDLEQYLGHPVYLRSEENYHPNTYRMEHLTLEQALMAVTHIEEGETLEGQVVNPDPEVSLAPLVNVKGIYVVVPNLDAPVGARVKVHITEAGTSLATAEPMAAEQRGIVAGEVVHPLASPPLVPLSALPAYLREERSVKPPRGLRLLSPSAEAVPIPVSEEENIQPPVETEYERRRRNRKQRPVRREQEVAAILPAPAPEPIEEFPLLPEVVEEIAVPAEVEVAEAAAENATTVEARRRRRRRRGGRGRRTTVEVAGENVLETVPAGEEALEEELSIEEVAVVAASEAETVPEEAPAEVTEEVSAATERNRRRRRSRSRRHAAERLEAQAVTEEATQPEPVREEINVQELLSLEPPAQAISAEAVISLLNAIPESLGELVPVETVPEEAAPVEVEAETPAVPEPIEEAPVAPEIVEEAPAPKRRRAPRARKPKVVAETPELPVTPEEAPTSAPTPEPEAAPEIAAVAPEAEAAPAVEQPAAAEPEVEQPATPEEAPPAEKKPARRRTPVRRRTKKTEEPAPPEEGNAG